MSLNIIKFFVLILIFTSSVAADIECRLAIDIGSGSTKVAIGEVDTETNQILTVLYENSFPVPYQAALDKSSDSSFDAETQARGINTFLEIQKLAIEYQVHQIAAVATSAFRKSSNGPSFAERVAKETGISIRIIPQREEGEIAFFSALAAGQYAPEEILVWDIGTGSLQMTTKDEAGELLVYMGEEMGSLPFKSYIMEEIQNKGDEDGNSPNPMNDDDFYSASRYARAFARKAPPSIKKKIQQQLPVVGIGRLFNSSLAPLAEQKEIITRNDLRHYIISALNKPDEELDNPFAHVDVSNSMLALAIMKALHIHAIIPIETTTTKGMLVYNPCWHPPGE